MPADGKNKRKRAPAPDRPAIETIHYGKGSTMRGRVVETYSPDVDRPRYPADKYPAGLRAKHPEMFKERYR
eukprot:4173002-Alexandrium_andersonii.AAC.1